MKSYRKQSKTLILGAVLAALAIGGGVFLLPPEAISGDLVRLLVVCTSVVIALFAVHDRRASADAISSSFRKLLVLWFFLLCSEAFFPRANNGAENAAAGNFSLTAYTEAIFWIFLAVCLLVIAYPAVSRAPARITDLLKTRFAIALAIAALSIISIAWAPEKPFSAAWSFKLLLGVALVALLAAHLRSVRDLRTLFVVTFGAFAFLTIAPVVEGTINSSAAFSGSSYAGEAVVEEGRFHSTAHPLVLAGRAGILALLALLFHTVERKRYMIAVALGSAVVIGLAGAKTAFLAAIIAVGLLFSLRRRMVAAFGLVCAFALLGVIIVSTTAVGDYLKDYLQSGDLMTISGRTDLWSAAWPEITSHLALGHGYVASKLVSLEVGIPWYAGHMHNAILETLYNNGLPGLALLLALNFFIVQDLVNLYRRSHRRELQSLAISLIALYTFLFLNGLTEPYFGGQASAFYLLLIALFAASEWLRRFSTADATARVAVTKSVPSESPLHSVL